MIRAIVWKEYREHRMVWLLIALLGVLVLVGLTQFLGPKGLGVVKHGEVPDLAVGIAFALVTIYGLVCGSMMFAGEREAGTLGFLDILAWRRRTVCLVKFLFGALLTSFQVLLLIALGWMLGIQHHGSYFLVWFPTLGGMALLTYASGLLASSFCRTVLAAVGLSLLLLLLCWFMMGLLGIFESPLIAVLPPPILFIIGAIFVFCQTDIQRGTRMPGVSRRPVITRAKPTSLRSLLWLTFRQTKSLTLILCCIPLLFGLFLPVPGLVLWVLWPAGTLLFGVLLGTAVFAGEQRENNYRFLGNQRLPPSRIWLVKIGFYLGLVLIAALLTLATASLALEIIRADTLVVRALLDRTIIDVNPWVMQTLWVVYGFSTGQFFGLISKKSIVTVVLSLFTSVIGLALWLPSLVCGGLPVWHLYMPPLILIIGTGLAMRPWLAGRLAERRPATGLAVCSLLALGWIAGSLTYRIYQIPDVGEPFDVNAYMNRAISVAQAEGEQLIRQGAEDFLQHNRKIENQISRPTKPLMFEKPPPEFVLPVDPTFYDQARLIFHFGWPKEAAEMDRWLDMACDSQWVAHLRQAAKKPLGVTAVRELPTVLAKPESVDALHRASIVMSARGLQLQARGDSQAGFDHLMAALHLFRILRTAPPPRPFSVSEQLGEAAFFGFKQWLERASSQADSLRYAFKELLSQEANTPSASDYVRLDYYLARRDFGRTVWPTANYVKMSTGKREIQVPSFEKADRDALDSRSLAMTTLARRVPWERQRYLRIMKAVYAGRMRAAEVDLWRALDQPIDREGLVAGKTWLPATDGLGSSLTADRLNKLVNPRLLRHLSVSANDFRVSDWIYLAELRLRRIRVALALYRSETGKPAGSLQDLVPKYLNEITRNPYDGQPFTLESVRKQGGD